ncbi:hypothetical protein ACLBWP_11135 [Microbacterium sp. M1A1_1b]|uniref:hypothetical protein n=1 Tax=Curtobacterium sp. VKM Ac-2922 TaxID=2929475 RepID=UPI001FB4F78F|nr:hypothetical protein [Curtobacterium sp. VKM Ac-2922]MCJ1715257.1 hypothetical protein [Curtobacterium sp. VKM Ac-2922]
MSASSGRPTTVTVSYVLWLITVLVGIISGIVGFFSLGDQTNGMGGALVAGAVIAIIIAIVELFIVFRMRDGRNWARIVLLVLAILQVLGVVSAFSVLGTIGLIAVVIATVLMFLPSSNGYFRRG